MRERESKNPTQCNGKADTSSKHQSRCPNPILARDGQRWQRDAIDGIGTAIPFVQAQLQGGSGPILAASDYVRAVPEALRADLPDGRRYTTLGTDGFGRSDTRAALRAFFKVDAASIVAAALQVV